MFLGPVKPYDGRERVLLPERLFASGLKISYSPGLIVDSDLKAIPGEYLSTPDGKPGLLGEYFDNPEFTGEPVEKQIDKTLDTDWGNEGPGNFKKDDFSIRWTGKLSVPESGEYLIGTTSDDGSRLYVNEKLVVDNWGDHAMVTKNTTLEFSKDKPVDIKVEFYEHGGGAGIRLQWQKVKKAPIEQAIQLAKESDAVILFMGFSDRDETEGMDRKSNALSVEQVDLIKKVTAVNKNVVVVFNSGAGILMNDWVDKVPSIIESWYPGEQGGYAIADILLGNVNPSGKLVTTFFKKEEDTPTYNNYPGKDDELYYKEGLFVGYRHYDKYNIEPLFPFGHGLSYTDFEYSDLKISSKKVTQGQPLSVTLKLKNIGEYAGAEVVQLYLKDNESSVVRPVKELKGFTKIFLKAGEEKEVTLNIAADAMKFWNVSTNSWKAEPGKFTVLVGSSSRDIRLKDEFYLK